MEGGQTVRPLTATDLAVLGLLGFNIYAFASAYQGVVAAGVSVAVSPPSLSAPMGKGARFSLLHLRFACRVPQGGRSRKGENRVASHPESGPDEGPAIFLPGFWMKG